MKLLDRVLILSLPKIFNELVARLIAFQLCELSALLICDDVGDLLVDPFLLLCGTAAAAAE